MMSGNNTKKNWKVRYYKVFSEIIIYRLIDTSAHLAATKVTL